MFIIEIDIFVESFYRYKYINENNDNNDNVIMIKIFV